MRTIINNQKKERDILLSRPYLTRNTQYDVGELKCSNLTIVTMNEERVIEKDTFMLQNVKYSLFKDIFYIKNAKRTKVLCIFAPT
jgi:hypothetical protein